MLPTKPCAKCGTVLSDKEYIPSPHLGRKKSSSIGGIQDIDSFTEEDSQSFVMVEKRSDEVKRKIEQELKRELRSYIYWEKFPLKHALCRNCVDFILHKELRDGGQKLKEKQEAAEEFLPKARRATSFFAAAATDERYELALKEKERLKAELNLLGKKLAEEKKAFLALKAETDALTEQEAEFAREAMKWRGDKHRYQERWDASLTRHESANAELAGKSTILNDTFHVWVEQSSSSLGEQSPYFSINGIRMGRKPSGDMTGNTWSKAEGATDLPASEYDVVEWREVNMAWGEACLLLCVLANKAQVTFKEYELIPRGPRSIVKEKRNPQNMFKLYYEGDIGKGAKESTTSAAGTFFSLLGFALPNQNIEAFNQAMMGFLVCLKELAEVARDIPRGTQLDLRNKLYPIKAEAPPPPLPGKEANPSLYMDATIQGLSIRTTADPNDARRWTDACKLTLSNVKWLSVWAAGGGRKV